MIKPITPKLHAKAYTKPMAAKRQLDPETWFALKLFLVLIIVGTLSNL